MVVDFGHGMISEDAMNVLCSTSRFLAVNSQSNAGNLGYNAISKYKRANFICMGENEIRLEARDRQSDLKKLVVKVSETLQCDSVVVTQGKGGCLCYNTSEGFFEIPAIADQVVDRMGSGDAFLAVFCLGWGPHIGPWGGRVGTTVMVKCFQKADVGKYKISQFNTRLRF